MNKPNSLIYAASLILIVSFIFACSKKNKVVLDNDEKPITITGVTNLVTYPGRNRVKLYWKFLNNSNVQKFQITWGNNDKKEITPAQGTSEMEVILDGLSEGEYDFSVAIVDAKANVSAKTNVKGHVYGLKYEEGLAHREIKDVVFNADNKTVVINWNSLGQDMNDSELKYMDASNVSQTVAVPRSSSSTTLTNFKAGNAFEHRTSYQPAGSIDLFHTNYKSVTVNNSQSTPYLGSDWVLYTPVKKIHLDNEDGLQTYSWTSYKSVCSPVICADYSYDSNLSTETFQILSTKSNRSEIRVEDNYSTGSRQFSGYVKFDAPLNDECLVQIFGSTSDNATQLMIRGFSENGGTLKISTSFVLATGVYNKEVHINIIHLQEDVGSKMIVYIDGVKKYEKVDGEDATNYMKYGCYGTMKTGKAVSQWRDVKFYKNGKAPVL